MADRPPTVLLKNRVFPSGDHESANPVPLDGENRFRLGAAIGGHPPNRGFATLRVGRKGDPTAVGRPDGFGSPVDVSQPYFGAALAVKNPNGDLLTAFGWHIDRDQTPIG